MVPRPPDHRAKRSGHTSAMDLPRAKNTPLAFSKPFHKTHLGRLPPELREMIFRELLATPPSYAGNDFTGNSTGAKGSARSFVHIRASWHGVTRTCRQVYLEAYRIFFAAKAYYLDNSKDVMSFLGRRPRPNFPILRYDIITTLCLKDLVAYPALYTKEQIDQIFADPTDRRAQRYTREQLEALTYRSLGIGVHGNLFARLKSLNTVCLCIRVGEELLHVDFLFEITNVGKGLIEFVSATHWLIRLQRAEDVWRIQYACFFHSGYYGVGKDGEKIPYDLLSLERNVMHIDSRAPGLKEGDERYVEVEIRRFVEDLSRKPNVHDTHSIQYEAPSIQTNTSSLQVHPGGDTNDTESVSDMDHTDENLVNEEAQGTQPGVQQEQIIEDASETHLDRDDGVILSEKDSIPMDQTLASGQLTEGSRVLESDKDTNPEVEPTLPASVRGGIALTGSEAEPNRTDDLSLPGSFPAEPQNRPPEIRNDQKIVRQVSLVKTDSDNRHAQTDMISADQPLRADSQSNEAQDEVKTGAGQGQQSPEDKPEGESPLATTIHLSSKTKPPLLELVVTPNPYTEEEMESYYKWQCSGYAQTRETIENGLHQKQNPPSESRQIQDRHAKDHPVVCRTVAPQKDHRPPVSPLRARLLSRSAQLSAPFLICLLLVAFGLQPEWLANVRPGRKGSSQH